MIILIGFAFLAGVITILSPCILPILPIILSSTVDTGRLRPLGVVTGFIFSFTFFTLFLSTIVKFSGIPAESLRFVSIFILILFGVSLFIPQAQLLTEKLFSKLTQFVPNGQNEQALSPSGRNKHGFFGGFVIGLSIGLLWTPCVGPILASVISLALSGSVTTEALFITLAYALGTAIPMFLIMQGGSKALQKVPWLLQNSNKIQKAFGVLMVLTAVGVFFNLDRKFQTFVLNTFPQYGSGLVKFEDNETVINQLDKLNAPEMDESQMGKPMSALEAQKGPIAPEIIPGGEWLNSPPLTMADLKGKVVLIDFWTYSCINCQRTFPYLKNWWNKYQNQGLVIIGVHSPEFEFEKSLNNVAQAAKDFDLQYPIVQDNNFATWKAYSNRYWPAKYLIDKDGFIRYSHFGEGDYNETEQMIQTLLKESGATNLSSDISNPEYQIYAKTPELYLGYGRIEYLSSPEKIIRDKLSAYTIPVTLPDNHFAYSGQWNLMKEYSNPQKGAALELDFDAKEVFLVMRSKQGQSQAKVTLDGEQKFMGVDVKDGVVTVSADTLYKLINLDTPGKHKLRLEFLDSNTEIYAFTFG